MVLEIPTMSSSENKPLSVGDWIITFIILAIPLVNIIAVFVWAFSASTQPSKKSYAQALIIVFIFSIVLAGIFLALAAAFAPVMPS